MNFSKPIGLQWLIDVFSKIGQVYAQIYSQSNMRQMDHQMYMPVRSQSHSQLATYLILGKEYNILFVLGHYYN